MAYKLAVICEDDVLLARAMEFVLVQQNFVVYTAADGGQAVELIREKKPGIVLLDWEMPVKDGRAVLRELDGEADAPYIVALPSARTSESPEQIMALGAHDVLPKPFFPAQLSGRLESLARRRRI